MVEMLNPNGKQVREFASPCEVFTEDGEAMIRTRPRQVADLGASKYNYKTNCYMRGAFEAYGPQSPKKRKAPQKVVLFSGLVTRTGIEPMLQP